MSPTSSSSPGRMSSEVLSASLQTAQGLAMVPTYKVCVVDADGSVKAACHELASRLQMSVVAVGTFADAQAVLVRNAIDLLLLDLDLTGTPGLQQLEGIRASHPEMAVVVVTAAATVQAAVEAMRLGASDFLTAPIAVDELAQVLERASRRISHDAQSKALHRNLTNTTGMGRLVGRSAPMEKVYRMISKVAFTAHPVLILGDSGVGKELVARTIHEIGPRADRPFVSVYCNGTIDDLERDLFGYAKGAFPSAQHRKDGQLVEADHGTIFLHGVDELPLEMQAKLVRVLQEHEIKPMGSNGKIPLQARIIASAKSELFEAQEQGKFRRDLFFRLNVVNIRIPSLTDRREDIPLLTDGILKRIRQESGVPYELDSEMRNMLDAHDWPGNVRELESALERGCLMGSSPFLTASDFSTQLQQHRYPPLADAHLDAAQLASGSYIPKSLAVTSIAKMEKDAILSTLQHLRGDKLKAAKLLGIGKTTLYRKLKEYDIEDAGSV